MMSIRNATKRPWVRFYIEGAVTGLVVDHDGEAHFVTGANRHHTSGMLTTPAVGRVRVFDGDGLAVVEEEPGRHWSPFNDPPVTKQYAIVEVNV